MPDVRRPPVSAARAARRAVFIALPVLVVLYGAALRFDALTLTRGAVAGPPWLRALQESRGPSSAIRPDGVTWTPVTGRYISDPYTYLRYAREMRSFYAAHRREPLFPFATKMALGLLDDHDVAVSVASASFSVMAIAATFLLGAYAFSYAVGLGAALALAVEYDVITWSVGGWRDDAFTCAVVLSAYAMIRYARDPSRRHAVLLGVVAGLACLVRITALSFVLPGFAALFLMAGRPVKERVAGLALGLSIMAAIVAPFIINCWRTFGDPFYAINVHANVYRAAEGQAEESGLTAVAYLRGMARTRPFETADTVALGLTAYPFQNKWRGFDPWVPGLGRWLSWASLLGLFLFTGSAAGRLLLVVLAASLVPYAATWKLIADWRFTAHAYPIFLVAAGAAVSRVVLLATPSGIRVLRASDWKRRLLPWALTASVFALLVWIVLWMLPAQTVRESLLAGEAVTVAAGPRDRWFFTEGWSRPVTEGNVTARVSHGPFSVVRVNLPRKQDYGATLRLDPFPRPLDAMPSGLPAVRVFLNGRRVARIDLRWNPERVGSYDIRLPADAVLAGVNRMTLLAEGQASSARLEEPPRPGSPAGVRFRLWYVRVRP
ncbi:MAG: glycosyltransferase family 39 protein [Vicinamibacterales bacterium]